MSIINKKRGKRLYIFFFFTILFSFIGGFALKYFGNQILQLLYGVKYGFWFWFTIASLPSIILAYTFDLYERYTDSEIENNNNKRKIAEVENLISIEREAKERANKEISLLLETKEPFKFSASIIASLKTHIFNTAADYLDKKWNPAHHTANEIRGYLKRRMEEAEIKCRTMQFKYDFLLNSLPQLKDYMESESDLLSGSKSKFNLAWESLQGLFCEKEKAMRASYQQKEERLKREQDAIEEKQRMLDCEKEKLKELLNSSKPFSESATMISNLTEAIFDEAETHLIEQRHAEKSAEVVREFKVRAVAAEKKLREMIFKYEFLISIFPELEKYIETEEELVEISRYDNYLEFEEGRDKRQDYLSNEEWQNLTSIEKSQLALDRWKTKKKSSHTVGMLYEMYISYMLQSNGHKVIEFGIKKGIKDLGRDIISYKDGKTYIIQCKNWSKTKQIHENVVCQLMGTALEYELNNPLESVIPVLVTTTNLSDTAKKFADRLNVIVKIIDLGEFPVIKCNINGGNKIYHLPFDQQYERVEINKPGEIYAWTVREAEEKGFRHAMKHFLNKS